MQFFSECLRQGLRSFQRLRPRPAPPQELDRRIAQGLTVQDLTEAVLTQRCDCLVRPAHALSVWL